MAKKILISFSLILLLLVGVGVYALDITDDEEFEEVTTDTSFMLDSPLFTHVEDKTEYVQPAVDMEADGYEKVLENDKFEFYHSKSKAYSIRVVDKSNGFVWSNDVGTAESRQAFKASVIDGDGKDQSASAGLADEVEITPKVKATLSKVVYSVKLKYDNITFDYEIALTDSGIKFSLLNDTIKEKGDSKLISIDFFQYFGAVKGAEVPGYIVIPSGNGGLIRYSENSVISSSYLAPFYGSDLNRLSEKDSLKDVLNMPVYGFVHGVDQNACLVEIKEGSANSLFNYIPAGYKSVQKHNQSYLSFVYREPYVLKTANSEFTLVPEEYYQSNIEVEYSFLSGSDANYVGLAKQYQESLVEDGVLGNASLATSTQMHVEAFGREYEEGLIFKKYHNMTTISDLLDIDAELKENGVDNILYTLKGFYTGGFSASKPSNVNFDSVLGSLHTLEENGINYYLYYNPVETTKERLSYPSYNLVNVYRNEYYLTVEEGAKYTFYSDMDTIGSGLNTAIDKYGSKVSFDGITKFLYGDYNRDYEREESVNVYYQALNDNLYPMYSPNAYLLKNTDKYLTMDLYHERMRFITDSVPFAQIVLRGYIDMYSTYLNFSSNQDLDGLKCIEYGVYPAYLITKEASHNLSNTLSSDLFATEYSRVKDKMFSQYEFIKEALDNVVGAQIVDRNVLKLGIVEVVYSNGVTIVVNYTNNSYLHRSSGRQVKSMGYEVIING